METLGIEEEHMIGPAKCSYKPTTIIGPNSRASNSQNFGAKVSNQNFPPKCKTSKIKEKRNRERERERERKVVVNYVHRGSMLPMLHNAGNILLSIQSSIIFI